jgi:hypothetical protein
MTIVSGLRIIDSNAQTGITWWNWTDNHIPHVVLIGQSAKELGNNIHTRSKRPYFSPPYQWQLVK